MGLVNRWDSNMVGQGTLCSHNRSKSFSESLGLLDFFQPFC